MKNLSELPPRCPPWCQVRKLQFHWDETVVPQAGTNAGISEGWMRHCGTLSDDTNIVIYPSPFTLRT